MGTGTDVAMASAGVTLVKGDLGGTVRARPPAPRCATSGKTFLAFLYNGVGVPIAAGVLYLLSHRAHADDRGGRHGAIGRKRHRQRAAAAARGSLSETQPQLARTRLPQIDRRARWILRRDLRCRRLGRPAATFEVLRGVRPG